MYELIKSGSDGNAIIYHSTILVDCGVSFKALSKHIGSLQIVLLTHAHTDHLNISTLRKLQFERPTLRFGCGFFLAEKLKGFKNVDIYEAGKIYDYGVFKISPVELTHDVPNFGYRIFKGEHKTLHCTDCAHLEGIDAIDYDLYAIEHNYDEDVAFEQIADARANGLFTHKIAAINNHLSEQQAAAFIYKNKGKNSRVLRLHESKT